MSDQHAWWRDAVIYQVYPRSFADSDGDGVGDIPGIRAHLDHIADLGVGAVWLSPVYPSPMADNGYDISDYQDIDPMFGTLADFDGLVADLHERGLRLVIDVVVNHCSDEHPWFTDARSSRGDPKRDWFWWRPARPDLDAGSPGAEPNNWGSFFGGPAWTFDEATAEYYLHLFDPKQPDLNWENPELRAALFEMLRWWVAHGVDGFRLDVINLVSKDPDLPDGPVAHGLFADPLVANASGPRIHEFMAELRREVLGDRTDFLLVGETPGVTIDEARRFTDASNAELDMVFQFEHMDLDRGATKWDVRPLRLTDLKASLGRWQAGLSDVGWNSLYWSNHDQPRPVSRYGDAGEHRVRSAVALAALLQLHRGTPYVYQGDEIGMTNAPFAGIEDFLDVESLGHYLTASERGDRPEEILESLRAMSRDNARTPMQWDASPNAGFSSGTPWLSVNPNFTTVNAQSQRTDPTSVFGGFRQLADLRRRLPVVADGDFTLLLLDDELVYAYARRTQQEMLLVLVNVSGGQARPDVGALPDGAPSAAVVFTNYPEEPPAGLPALLRPWEALGLHWPLGGA